jgi:hypothetical protein
VTASSPPGVVRLGYRDDLYCVGVHMLPWFIRPRGPGSGGNAIQRKGRRSVKPGLTLQVADKSTGDTQVAASG